MKIPKKLKIGGHVWRIEKSKDVTAEGNCFGSTHGYSQKLFLDPTSFDQKRNGIILQILWGHLKKLAHSNSLEIGSVPGTNLEFFVGGVLVSSHFVEIST